MSGRRTAPLPQTPSADDAPQSSLPAAQPEPATFNAIWGTNVSIVETASIFGDFLRNFKPKWRGQYDDANDIPRTIFSSADPNLPSYPEDLRKMRLTGETGLNLDVVNLLAYPPAEKLWWQLQKYPQEVIPAMDQALKDVMITLAEDDNERPEIIEEVERAVYKIRPMGFPAGNMRDLNPSQTDHLITIKGLVIRATPIIPDMTQGKYLSSHRVFSLLTLNHSILQMFEMFAHSSR